MPKLRTPSTEGVLGRSELVVYLERIARGLSRRFNWIAGGTMVAMRLLICANVISRYFGYPISGTFEGVGFLCVVVIAFALARTQILRGHISVEFFMLRLPPRAQAVINSITHFLCVVFFSLLAWQSVVFGTSLLFSGEVSPTEKIPFYPFVYGIALACVPACLVFLIEFLTAVRKLVKR